MKQLSRATQCSSCTWVRTALCFRVLLLLACTACLPFWPIRQAWRPPPASFRIVRSHLAPASGSICCKHLLSSRPGLAGVLVCGARPQSFLSHDCCPSFCMTAVPMPSPSPCFRPSGCVQWHRCRQPLWWVAPHRPTRPTKLAKGQSCVSPAQPAQHQRRLDAGNSPAQLLLLCACSRCWPLHQRQPATQDMPGRATASPPRRFLSAPPTPQA